MKLAVIVYFFLSLCFKSKAQLTNISISQKLCLHTANSENNIDASSILSNQAVGISVDEFQYGMLAEKKYLMNELNQLVFFVGKKYGKNHYTLIQDYIGFSESYSMQTCLGFTKFISENTSIGVRFNCSFMHMKGKLNSSIIGGEISLKQKLTKTLQAGLIIINPHGFFYKQNEGHLKHENSFKWGLLYDISKQFYAFFDLIKSENSSIEIVGGCSYNFNKRVDAMYSFSINEMSNRLCIGFNLNKMKLKLMSSFHPQLGYSPSIMLLSNLNEKVRQ